MIDNQLQSKREEQEEQEEEGQEYPHTQYEIEYQSYSKVYEHESGHHLYLGDVCAANDKQFLRTQDIRLVVTAAIDMDHLKFQDNVKHVVYGLFDSKTENLSRFFRGFYQLIDGALAKNNALVHCFAGISRSATLIISYIMKKNKIGFKQAIRQVRKARPNVLPNLGFERQLKEYEKVIKGQQILKPFSKRVVPRTSESKKHQPLHKKRQSRRQIQVQLPQIIALGKTINRQKNIQIFFNNYKNLVEIPITLSNKQIQPRETKIIRKEESLRHSEKKNEEYVNYKDKTIRKQQFALNKIEIFPFRIPITSFRKRSSQLPYKRSNLHLKSEPIPKVQISKAVTPYKLAMKQIKHGTQKNIKVFHFER